MINEHDIADMCNLYELHRGDKFKLAPEEEVGEPVKVPVAHDAFSFDVEYLFDHVDGMYSLRTTLVLSYILQHGLRYTRYENQLHTTGMG